MESFVLRKIYFGQQRFDCLNFCRYVVGLEEGGDDDDSAGSGCDHFGEGGALGDASDAEDGEILGEAAVDFGDVFEADGFSAGLGLRGVEGAEADVVGAFFGGGFGLLEGVGGAAGDGGFREGAVVLAYVAAGGLAGGGDFREIIDDEGDSGGGGRGGRALWRGLRSLAWALFLARSWRISMPPSRRRLGGGYGVGSPLRNLGLGFHRGGRWLETFLLPTFCWRGTGRPSRCRTCRCGNHRF